MRVWPAFALVSPVRGICDVGCVYATASLEGRGEERGEARERRGEGDEWCVVDRGHRNKMHNYTKDSERQIGLEGIYVE